MELDREDMLRPSSWSPWAAQSLGLMIGGVFCHIRLPCTPGGNGAGLGLDTQKGPLEQRAQAVGRAGWDGAKWGRVEQSGAGELVSEMG